VTRIILVRHGETEWNREERFRGRIDVDLNETGRAQAEACARTIAARWKPSAVYSSPLSRAVHTAEPIAHRCGLPVRRLEGLTDIDYGEWHGLTPDDARRRWPDLTEAWLRTPGRVGPPGGESLRALQARVLAAVQLLARTHGNDTIVAVAHTVVNRVLLLAAVDADLDAFFRMGQATGAINVIEVDEQALRAVVVNDTCHLA
jgi:broad specificity phosphatase PhoE